MILIGLMLAAPLACALPSNDATEDIGRQKSAVIGTTASEKYTSALSVGNIDNHACSGTLIAPNLVLTARQCVIPRDALPSSTGAITCGQTTFPTDLLDTHSLLIQAVSPIDQAEPIYRVKKIFVETETGWCGNDIALLELDTNIPASVAQPATPVVQFSLSDPANVGRSVTAVGYGRSTPTARDSGSRRQRGPIDILCIPGDDSYDCDPYPIDDRELVTDGYVCTGGDSGSGPYQLSQDDGTPYVLGAFSRADGNCRNAVYTRTDAHASLIVAAAIEAAAEGGYEAPQWAASGNDCGDGGDRDCAPTTVQEAVSRGCSATSRTKSPTPSGWIALAGVALVLMRRSRSASDQRLHERPRHKVSGIGKRRNAS